MGESNGNRPNVPRVPPLPLIQPFEANRQFFTRMPDGETVRIVEYGALDIKPTVIYVHMATLMEVVGTRMLEAAKQMAPGWRGRWEAYKAAAGATEQDYQAGILRLDGKEMPPQG